MNSFEYARRFVVARNYKLEGDRATGTPKTRRKDEYN